MINQTWLLEFLSKEHFFKLFCLLDDQIFYKQNKTKQKPGPIMFQLEKAKKSNQPRNGKKTFQT